MDRIAARADEYWQVVPTQLGSAEFYAQIGVIVVALLAAWALSAFFTNRVRIFREEPRPGVLFDLRTKLHQMHELLLPVMSAVVLGLATPLSAEMIGAAWLVRAAQGAAFIFLVYSLANHFISSVTMIRMLKWFVVPIALLFIVGWLDDVIGHLEAVSIEIGNIQLTLYAVVRTLVFGIVLFWLGRVSNVTGQRVIRNQPTLDAGTREVAAKLFEIGVFVVIFLLLLNVMGIDLTALAVVGGALGVGLGFGLQQIASNFISGIIILLDRSLTIGDYIELEDGRTGTLRELTMRSATLETYDGKDIMVPNERF
ncbi:MAG: mechanosensitive ion channel domain-containing protein, partial [Alphaproteobacteria bacterium]